MREPVATLLASSAETLTLKTFVSFGGSGIRPVRQLRKPLLMASKSLPTLPRSFQRTHRGLMPNNALERSCDQRGRAAVATDCVLAGAEWAPCQAAQLNR